MKRLRPWLPPAIALLWLGALELACDQPGDGAALWFGVVALTLALALETVMLWVRGAARAQKIALCVAGAVVVPVAILDVTIYSLVQREPELRTDSDAAAALPNGGSAEAVCPGCTILWHDEHTWLLGQARTEWFTCVYGIREFDPSGSQQSLMPDDFPAYAHLVDPKYVDDGLALGKFLSWQYPRRRFVLIQFEEGSPAPHIETAVETNRVPDSIYTVAPYFGGPAYEWENRFTYYRRLLQFTLGSSPHCRTDLEDDPYFALARGQRAQAEARFASLPADRRAFLERKLAAPASPPSQKPDDDLDQPPL
jgi:hypothetical protein